jgi:undecaprenyl-diphosphatase
MNVVDATLSVLSCVPCDERALVVRAVEFVADAELLKGGLLMAVLWGLWLAGRDARETAAIRGRIVMTVAGSFGALCAARLLALALPFRQRPFEAVASDGATALRALESWSAFPSDHAALFFALAAGIFTVSRRLGGLLLVHAVVVIALPRLYLGLHHPTDLIAGAGIGAACALAATRERVWRRCAPPVLGWGQRHGSWFAALAFVLTFEIATLFDSVRNGARIVWKAVRPIVRAAPVTPTELVALLALVALLLALGVLLWSYRFTAARQTSSSAR